MITFLLFLIYGGFVSAWHGGNWKLPLGKVWIGIFWAMPFGMFAIGLAQHAGMTLLQSLCLAVPCFLLCLGGKNTGAGNAIDNGTQPAGKPEKLEFLIRWTRVYLTETEYEALLNIVVGFAAVSGGVVAAAVMGHPLVALIIAIGGMLRAEIYPLCWQKFPKGFGIKFFTQPTQCAELLVGCAAFGALAIGVNLLF